VAYALRDRLHGAVATRLTEKTGTSTCAVRARRLSHSSIEELAALPIAHKDGASVTLDPWRASRPVPTQRDPTHRAASCRRHHGQPVRYGPGLRIFGHPPEPGLRTAAFGIYPPELSGQSRELERSTQQLAFAMVLALFLIYFVMASEFESLLHPSSSCSRCRWRWAAPGCVVGDQTAHVDRGHHRHRFCSPGSRSTTRSSSSTASINSGAAG